MRLVSLKYTRPDAEAVSIGVSASLSQLWFSEMIAYDSNKKCYNIIELSLSDCHM